MTSTILDTFTTFLPTDDTLRQDRNALAHLLWNLIAESPLLSAPIITVHGLHDGLDYIAAHPADGPDAESRLAAALATVMRAGYHPLGLARTTGAQLLTRGGIGWPERVADLGAAEPHALWILGNLALLSRRTLTVTGSRASTGYGEHVTADLVGQLRDDVVIAAGASYGIDSVAHRTALASGLPTVAYLSNGIDRTYPTAHEALLRRIAQEGAVIAERPAGASATRFRMLERNRLLAANADAVLVAEAGARSGALNVAGHALHLQRPVGAIPGPVTSASSVGCHRLIREFGAELITSADDVRDMLP
ncbi:DNA-protecting protein DprA [Microbacteriaceae bacterium VKM Ac-2855]|nr:DNA-protecting protein DprA [Microbacteriaceae bacterium VKM Ac-2855]